MSIFIRPEVDPYFVTLFGPERKYPLSKYHQTKIRDVSTKPESPPTILTNLTTPEISALSYFDKVNSRHDNG